MRVHTVIAGFGLVLATLDAHAQAPPNSSLPGVNSPLPGGTLPGTGSLPGGSLPGTGTLPGSSGYLPGPSGTMRLPAQPLLPTGSQQPSPFPLPQASGFPASFGPSTPATQQPSSTMPNTYGQPPALFPNAPQSNLNPASSNIAQPQPVMLPQPENKFFLNVGDLSLKRVSGGWQLWVGQRMFRDFGDNELEARGVARILRDLKPTEWVAIGAPKPVVEYGLSQGKAALVAGMPNFEDPNNPSGQARKNSRAALVVPAGADQVMPIELRTVRIEAIRGVWCLRDESNILLNFGSNKADADQALAAVRKYAFNRLGIVAHPNTAMTYFFASPDTAESSDKGPFTQAAIQSQISSLHKVGVPVAGLGYVGEMIHFDPKSLTLRKEGSDWVVVAGNDVLGRFGPVEYIALDAIRTIQQARFTEYCTVGSSGLTFFLTNGRAPSRAPFNTQGRTFDPNSLSLRQTGDHWAITESGRFLFDCASAEEGEIIIRLLQVYQFDQLCHIGPSPKTGISFLAKTR